MAKSQRLVQATPSCLGFLVFFWWALARDRGCKSKNSTGILLFSSALEDTRLELGPQQKISFFPGGKQRDPKTAEKQETRNKSREELFLGKDRGRKSPHYLPGDCLVNGGFPVFWWKKAMFQICKMYVLRSLIQVAEPGSEF